MPKPIYVKNPHNGKWVTLNSAARTVGVSPETIARRHKRGLEGEALFEKPTSPHVLGIQARHRKNENTRKKITFKSRKDMIKHVLSDRNNLLLSRPMGKGMAKKP